MKKRIIASTMASVMAISSAATMLVSSAVEVKDVTKEHADKKDLQNLLEKPQIVELRDGGVDDYGSVASENFLRAIELATNLVESNGKVETADYTAAYQMVIAAAEKLVHYTKEQLRGLLDDSQEDYDTNNFLNDHGDLKFKTGWDEFERRWDEADAVRDSDDLRDTTDAYENLEKAWKALVKYDTVTKTDAKNARQAYEAIQSLEFKYQPWQRGKVTLSGDKLKDKEFAWGALYAHAWSANETLIAVVKEFEDIKNYNITSDQTIYNAVKAMERAVKVINSFDTSLESGSQTKMKSLISKYYGQLVYTYNSDFAGTVVTSLLSVIGDDNVKFKTSTGSFMAYTNIDGDGNTVTNIASIDEYWNTHTGTSYNRRVDACLEVQIATSAASDAFYITNPKNMLANGNRAIYSPDGAIFFWDNVDDANAAAKAAGIPERYVTCLRKSTVQSLKISDYIPVGADEVMATGSISIDTANDTAVIAAATAAYATLAAISSAAAAANTAASTSMNITADNVTALKSLAGEIVTAVGLLSTALDDDTVKTATSVTPAGLKAAQQAYDAVQLAVDAYLAEAKKLKATLGATNYGTLADSLVQKNNLLKVEFGTGATKFPAKMNEFCGEYYELAAEEALSSGTFHTASNAVYEGGETISDPLSFEDFDGVEAFDDDAAYLSKRPTTGGDHNSDITGSNLAAAMIMYEAYTYNAWGNSVLLDNQLMISANSTFSGAPNSNANKILYNYLKYSLEDCFLGSKENGKTLADVKKLITSANEMDDKTHEISLFNVSRNAMIIDRTAAIDWVRQAEAQNTKNSKNPYTDYVSTYAVTTRKGDEPPLDSDEMWTRLNESYSQLSKEYDAFLYSFGDIIDNMAKIASAVDAGKYSESAAKKITDALAAVSLQMLELGDTPLISKTNSEINDTSLFNGDGTINRNNRLFTYGKELNPLATELTGAGALTGVAIRTNENKAHDNLKKEYDKLVAAYADAQKELEKPKDELVYDIDGVNGVTVSDVMMLIDLVLAGNKETAKYDYDNSGSVGVSDVLILIDKAMGK